MQFVSPELEEFCIGHSTLPSAHCAAIHEYTLKNVPMALMVSGPLVGSVLSFLISALGARRVLEVGTFTGYSALVMAEALPADGQVVTLDVDPATQKIAQSFWDKSPHGKKIEARLGSGLETLQNVKGTFDFVFIDADKSNYIGYLQGALERLSPKGVIVADNCLWNGQVLDRTTTEVSAQAIRAFDTFVRNHTGLQKTLIPVRDGLFLIRPIR